MGWPPPLLLPLARAHTRTEPPHATLHNTPPTTQADDVYSFVTAVEARLGARLPVGGRFTAGQSLGGLVAALSALRDQRRWAGLLLCSGAMGVGLLRRAPRGARGGLGGAVVRCNGEGVGAAAVLRSDGRRRAAQVRPFWSETALDIAGCGSRGAAGRGASDGRAAGARATQTAPPPRPPAARARAGSRCLAPARCCRWRRSASWRRRTARQTSTRTRPS